MRWYVERSGKIRGPFEEEAIRELIANGKIDKSCRVRSETEGDDAWRSLGEVREFVSAALPINQSPEPASTPSVPPARMDRTTLNIDRLEKLGRLLLWLALAATIVLVPIGLAKERRTEADTEARIKDATRASEEKLATLTASYADKTPRRIMLESIGNGLTALNTDNATGQLWFTNVSPRAGYVCVAGEAKNSATLAVTRSLPACAEVPPYASAVHLTVMFAGNALSAVCKTGQCNLDMKDAAP